MKSDVRSRLIEAQKRKLLVRFSRPFDDGASTTGFVNSVGPKFFLLASIDGSSVQFNGFECHRVLDARKLEVPCKHSRFICAALRKLGELKPKKPAVNLDSIEQLIDSASRIYPLITIYRERVDNEICQIGKAVGLNAGKLSLLEITPHATWDAEPTVYRLNQITRVDFGGGYERALHLVGGDPPPAL